MCGGSNFLSSIFGGGKVETPTIQTVTVPETVDSTDEDMANAKEAAKARKKALAALRATQTVFTTDQGLLGSGSGSGGAKTLKTLLGGA
ncbi:hypothetical protein [Desulfocurvus sp. DL9XJH121]